MSVGLPVSQSVCLSVSLPAGVAVSVLCVQSDTSDCDADGASGQEPAQTLGASNSLAAGGDLGSATEVLGGESGGVGAEGVEGARGGTKRSPLHGEETVE